MVRPGGGASITVTVPMLERAADVRHSESERNKLPRRDNDLRFATSSV